MAYEEGVLFVPYADTIDLLTAREALMIAEDVYRMQGEGSVMASTPTSFKLDVGEPFHNHWHVKCALLKETPITGVRLYNYFDDGDRNTVGQLECGRYIILADPNTGTNKAIVEEHWTYAIRSAAATTLPLKWFGPKAPKVIGLIGVGTMATNALRCLVELYDGIEEIRCTSRRPETREAFAAKWSEKLGIRVVPKGGGQGRGYRHRRDHLGRDHVPGILAQAGRHLCLLYPPGIRTGRMGESRQGCGG